MAYVHCSVVDVSAVGLNEIVRDKAIILWGCDSLGTVSLVWMITQWRGLPGLHYSGWLAFVVRTVVIWRGSAEEGTSISVNAGPIETSQLLRICPLSGYVQTPGSCRSLRYWEERRSQSECVANDDDIRRVFFAEPSGRQKQIGWQ